MAPSLSIRIFIRPPIDSSSTMSFPLLRLPEVALGEVVKNFIPIEILFLVQRSQKARRLISRHRRLHPIKITEVDGQSDSYVQIFYGDREVLRIFAVNQGKFNLFWRFKTRIAVRYLVHNEMDTLISFWTEKVKAFQEILDFLNEIFRIKEISFEIVKGPSNWVVPVFEYVKAKIGKSEASNGRHSIESERYPKVFSWLLGGLFRMDQLQGPFAWFMTTEILIALRNCKHINLEYIRLNAIDMNKVLREYTKNPGNLQELRITYPGDADLKGMVKGLNIVRFENKETNPKYWFITDNGIRFSLTKENIGAIMISRDN
uniref:F-box domain-containing protein n=2 Tax=Caenorhabditis tropicalis TaxID=1561998 RepID=A0A1I7UT76_9PELO